MANEGDYQEQTIAPDPHAGHDHNPAYWGADGWSTVLYAVATVIVAIGSVIKARRWHSERVERRRRRRETNPEFLKQRK